MDGPGLSPFGFAVDVERARHQIVTLLDGALWHLDATFASTRALQTIAEAPGPGLIHAGEIGRAMGTSRQAAAVLVKRHERAGRVVAVDEGWARSVRITRAGQSHLTECAQAIDRALGGLRYLPEEQLTELGDILHRLAQLLEGRFVAWPPDL